MRQTGNFRALPAAISSVRKTFLVTGIFSLFINVLMLATPLYMLQVYDRVLVSQSTDTLIALTVLVVALIGCNGFLELVRSRINNRLGAEFETRLLSTGFLAMIQQRLSGVTGSNGQILRDLETLRGFISGPALASIFDSPWTPVFVALIFVFHPTLGSIALIGAALLFLLAVLSEIRSRGPVHRAVGLSGASQEFLSGAIRNAESVRAMGMLTNLRGRWEEMQSRTLDQQFAGSDRTGTASALAKFVRPCLQISILCAGAYLVIAEEITPGVMIAASIVMGRALAPVEASIGHWRSIVLARSAYSRLKTDLREFGRSKPVLPMNAPKGRLDLNRVDVTAPGAEMPILSGVRFSLSAGESLAVVGPSGAGKSALARTLVGVWHPSAGTVRLDMVSLRDWNPEDLGQHIGFVPQDIELLAGSVAENIGRFGAEDPDGVIEAARFADAHEMILSLPDGYNTVVGLGGKVLSGGQRQRIALARALYGLPALIVLDEPNANLDAKGEAALMAAMRRLKTAGRTVVLITHRSSSLKNVDKVLVLGEGRQRLFGPRDEVLRELMGNPTLPDNKGAQRPTDMLHPIGAD